MTYNVFGGTLNPTLLLLLLSCREFYVCVLCLRVGIQQYLFENNRIDNIFTDFYYDRFTDCLNEILQAYQVSLNSQGSFCARETPV